MNFRLLVLLGTAVAPAVPAQKAVDITGTWRVAAGADTRNGPREVIIRDDSSASWGRETVRWRLKDDRISIVLGGEWETHRITLKENTLTLSGGGLDQPLLGMSFLNRVEMRRNGATMMLLRRF